MPRAAPKKMKKRGTKCGCKGGFNKTSLRKCNRRKAFKMLHKTLMGDNAVFANWGIPPDHDVFTFSRVPVNRRRAFRG